MSDIYFSIIFLLTAGLIGLPIARLLPSDLFPQRMFAAPVLGFALVGVLTAIVYRYDGSIRGVIYLAAIAAAMAGIVELASSFSTSNSFPNRSVLLTIATAAAVLMLCLAPKWTGGDRFAVFQGNQYDQLNYMTQSSAYRASKTYSKLSTYDGNQQVLTLGKEGRWSRPAPQIFLAALSESLGLDTISATYPYIASLQALTFFGLAFLIGQIFAPRIELTLLCAAAGTLGFPMQYIFDINAWGKLAGMPVAVTGLSALITLLSAPKGNNGYLVFLRIAVSFAIIVAGILYYYPEMIPVYGTAALGATAVGLVLIPRKSWLWNLLPALVGLLMGIGVGLLFWEGTLGVLVVQISFVLHRDVDWWKYFQAYLVAGPVTDFLTAAIGLYFILPPKLPVLVAIPWRLATYAFTATVVIGAALAWYRVGWSKPRPLMLLAGTLFALAEITVTAITGKFWPAGSALVMLGPVLFVVIVAPLLLSPVPKLVRIVSLSFAALYLAFGLGRPIFAANSSGVHYSLPYPATMDPSLKSKYNWNVSRLAAALKDCKVLVVDVDNRFFERYLAIYLTDHEVAWNSTHPGIIALESITPRLTVPIPKDADCVLTDNFGSPARARKVISVTTDKRVPALLRGVLQYLEIAPGSPLGVKVVGAYDPEPYRDGQLRWTSGEAHFLLPNNPQTPITHIRLLTWPVFPGRNMKVRISGTTVYDGPVPSDSTPMEWNIPDRSVHTIDIEIRAETFHGEGDPRDLGVALRSLVAAR